MSGERGDVALVVPPAVVSRRRVSGGCAEAPDGVGPLLGAAFGVGPALALAAAIGVTGGGGSNGARPNAVHVEPGTGAPKTTTNKQTNKQKKP